MNNNATPIKRNSHRTSFREIVEVIYPQLLLAANRAGVQTLGWSFGTPYGKGFYVRDGEHNLCEGWNTTHDAKIGLEAMISTYKFIASKRLSV